MSGAATSSVKNILKLESFCVFLIALLAYSKHGLGWKILAIFFFTPDLAFFGYLAGSTFGACAYNTTHS